MSAISNFISTAFGVFGSVIAVLLTLGLLYVILRSRWKVAGPNEALIVYGRRSRGKGGDSPDDLLSRAKIVVGSGVFVKPIFESYQKLSLEVITLDVDLSEIVSKQGIGVRVRGVAQVKVKSTIEAIRTAAQGFLSYTSEGITEALRETLAGHLRGIVGTLTVEELHWERASFQSQVREQAEGDLEAMGFEIKSFVVQEIQDNQNYMTYIATPRVAEASKQARIADAEANETSVLREEAAREAQERKRRQVDTALLEETRALELRQAEVEQEVNIKRAEAAKAGELASKVQDIKIQEQEVERQRREYQAEIVEKANAEKQAFETQAAARAQAAKLEAEAKAYAAEQAANAHLVTEQKAAEAVKARGLAEAEAEKAIGLAKAAAREKMAEALNAFNEAALQLELLHVLPEMTAAIASQMANVGKTTIISTGDGDVGTGAVKLAKNIPALLEVVKDVTGFDAAALLNRGERVEVAKVIDIAGGQNTDGDS